jgi:hypothetical protein
LGNGTVTVTGLAIGAATIATGGMKPPPDPHYRLRFPAEIISHAVWPYQVFSLRLREVEFRAASSASLRRASTKPRDPRCSI